MTQKTSSKRPPSRGISRRKEQYRLWFEFLKLAHQSDKPIIQQALKASAEFYSPWEIDKHEKFDDWWKDKSNLFNDTLEVRKLEAGALPDTPECLVVQIPLNRTQSELLAAVRKVLAQHYDDIGKTSRKNRALATSAYGLTGKGEMKTDAVRETLSVYRDVKLKNPASLKGKKLLAAIHDYYLKRRNKKWAVVPLPLQYDPESEEDLRRALRNMNRYLTNAESILLNVAQGEFPGHY